MRISSLSHRETRFFSWLTWLALDAKPVFIPQLLSSLLVHPDESQGENVGEQQGDKAHGALSVFVVDWAEERNELMKAHPSSVDDRLTYLRVSFCRPVKLCNVLDVEPLDKGSPDLRSQPVAKHEPDLVLLLVWAFRGVEQVAANLSNVLGGLWAKTNALKLLAKLFACVIIYRDVVLDAVCPVLRGRELLPHDHGDAVVHGARQGDHAGHRVVQGQRGVDHVVQSAADHDVGAAGGKDVSGIRVNRHGGFFLA